MLGEALRLLRVFNDLKAKELAIKLDISPNYLSEIEKGKKKPSMEIINKYSKVFNIKPSAILFFSEELDMNTGKVFSRKWIAEKLVKFLQAVESGKENEV